MVVTINQSAAPDVDTALRNHEQHPTEKKPVAVNTTIMSKKYDDSALWKLTRPWLSIVLIACIAVVYYNNVPTVNEETDFNLQEYKHNHNRLLGEEDEKDFVVAHEHHHHHKPIFNEEHKKLFPLGTSDYYGIFFAMISLMIAAGGGIGGGGMLVPIYLLVMGFSPKNAIPLSNVTVFGGAIANAVLNFSKRHPNADRPLIDWDLILIMEPLTIAGALGGAFLNKLLPEILLTFLLVVLLTFTAWTTLKKSMQMYKKETIAINLAKESELTKQGYKLESYEDNEAGKGLLNSLETEEDDEETEDDNKKSGTIPFLGDIILNNGTAMNNELALILEEERHIPSHNVKILVIMFSVVLAVNLLKGGGAVPSLLGIKCGTNSFWFANLFILAWIFAVSYIVSQYLVERHSRKVSCGYQYLPGDIQWDARACFVYPVICCLAGFVAGMFGIGGGIVKGPLMLAMGIHPAVGAASSATMILMTSFTATTSYVVFGLLLPDYAIMLATVGFVSTLLGQIGLTYLMKKSQRNSLIAFSIGGVVLISAFLMTIQSLIAMASGEKHHSGGICGKSS